MKLISMMAFIDSLTNEIIEPQGMAIQQEIAAANFRKCQVYSDFLKQPLTLGMFVPCDFEGNPLKEPRDLKRYNDMFLRNEQVKSDWMAECLFYEQAKERVLFEVKKDGKYYVAGHNILVFLKSGYDIEYLTTWTPNLTPTAIKQIGL